MRQFISILAGCMLTLTAHSQVKFVKSFYVNSPGDPTLTHNGKFLYVTSSNQIVVFEVNSTTGNLTKRSSYKGKEDFEYSGIHLSPDDRFLYTKTNERRNGQNLTNILSFACDPFTGALTLISSLDHQNHTTFDYSADVRFSPQGDLMFVSNQSDKELYVYRRNGSDGSFTFLNSTISNKETMFDNFTLSPDGKFMYVYCYNIFQEAIVYSINQSSGQLTKVQDVVNPVNPEWYAEEIQISPDGRNAYAIHQEANATKEPWTSDISQYSRDIQTGILTFQRNYPELKKEGEITELYIDGTGDFVYGLRAYGQIAHGMFVFKRDPITGNITWQQTFLDNYPTDHLKGIFQMDFSKDNQFLYATSARDYHMNIFQNPYAKASTTVTQPEVTEITATDDGFEWEYVNEPTNSTNYPYTQNTKPIVENNYERPNETIVSNGNIPGIEEEQFYGIWEKLKNESSDTKRLDLCYELLEGKPLKTVHVASVAILFGSEYKRLEFVKFASYFVKDKENFKLLGDLFTYESIKQDFYKLRI